MRKLFLSLVSVLASTSLMFGVAAAQSSSCTIDNTGPDSTNTCKVSEDKDVTINCTNKADVVFINKQQASSGDSLVLNNTNGGYATSGNAQNYNSTDGKLDVSCGPSCCTTGNRKQFYSCICYHSKCCACNYCCCFQVCILCLPALSSKIRTKPCKALTPST
jgi:hypothetical protein